MEAFHRALLDVIEVAHPNMMSFLQDLWQVASLADRDSALSAAGTPRLIKAIKCKDSDTFKWPF